MPTWRKRRLVEFGSRPQFRLEVVVSQLAPGVSSGEVVASLSSGVATIAVTSSPTISGDSAVTTMSP